MPAPSTSRRVMSVGVSVSVREHTPAGPGRPTVVLVHGYPDNQDTWSTLLPRLPLDDWHVVTYDVRGAGSSDAPRARAAYRTERLVDDLVAVLDAVLTDGEAVHLVGHDWGSAQLWDAVTTEDSDPRLTGRLGSFTSISAPSLDHVVWLTRHREGREAQMRRQALHSWYIGAFLVPMLPDLVWRRAHRWLGPLVAARVGLPRGHWGDGLGADGANGLGLYRANIGKGRRRRSGRAHTDVPVLVIHPTGDPFVTDVFLGDLDHLCSDVRVERIRAGHWVIVTHADKIAALVTAHVLGNVADH